MFFVCFDIFHFTYVGTNTYLVGTGPSRLLIDTGQGIPDWKSNFSTLLSKERARVSQALLTHWHHDHTSGVSDLRSLCPEVKVFKSNIVKGPQEADIWDGQQFAVEGATLTALYCPGHTKDHMAFLLAEEQAIFTGDNILGHGTAVFEDLSSYMVSLSQMRDRMSSSDGRTRGYPGHGEVIEDASAKIEDYIRHREQREMEVLRALTDPVARGGGSSGSTTSMDIVKIVYHEYPESLFEPARGGVLQVLRKLKAEGRIQENGQDQWTTTSSGDSQRSKAAL